MLSAVLGIMLGIAILLAMPFDVTFRLSKSERFRANITIAWAYGLLSRELGRSADNPVAPKSDTQRAGGKQPLKGRRKTRAVIAFMRSSGMPPRLLRLARDMWRQLRVRQLYLHVTFGLDDPADTGQLYGALVPVIIQSGRSTRLDLQIQPDFSQPLLRVAGSGQVRVIPITIIGVMISFLLSPTCWRGITAATACKS